MIIVELTGLILLPDYSRILSIFTWRVASQLKDPGQFEDPEDLENVFHA